MAMYIAIRKITEDNLSAELSFGLAADKLGRVRLDKLTGDLTLIEPAPDDLAGRVYSRAAFKIRQHWEEGQLPEATCWAS